MIKVVKLRGGRSGERVAEERGGGRERQREGGRERDREREGGRGTERESGREKGMREEQRGVGGGGGGVSCFLRVVYLLSFIRNEVSATQHLNTP